MLVWSPVLFSVPTERATVALNNCPDLPSKTLARSWLTELLRSLGIPGIQWSIARTSPSCLLSVLTHLIRTFHAKSVPNIRKELDKNPKICMWQMSLNLFWTDNLSDFKSIFFQPAFYFSRSHFRNSRFSFQSNVFQINIEVTII